MAPTTPASGWRRSLPIAAATVVLALAAACTDGEDGGEAVSSTTGPRPEWCGVQESLDLPEDAPDVEFADAPEELQILLQFLAELQVDLEAFREAGHGGDAEAAGAVEARTRIEAWGHENCGGPDPFCSLWSSVKGIFAAGPTEAPLEFVVDTLDDELIQYAPDAHVDAVKDHLVDLYASLGRPVPSDYEDGDAAAAYAELEAWVSSHC